ncbi:MAG: ATP synthase F0 subunit B [Bradymonadia bacterium]
MNRLLSVLFVSLWTSPAFAGGDFWTTTVLHTINLLILLALLIKGVGPKIKEVMAERSRTVGLEITEAEARYDAAEKRLSTYEEKLNALEAEAQKMVQEYRQLGEREAARIREDAQKEADRIKAEAKQLAARELDSARASIERDLVLSALDKAEADIKLNMTSDDKQRLIAGYFGDLEVAVQKVSSPADQEAS